MSSCLVCGTTDAVVFLVVRDKKGSFKLCSKCYRAGGHCEKEKKNAKPM